MTNSSAVPQTEQIIDILRELIRAKPRLRALLPAELVQLKERLGALCPEGGTRRGADFELCYRVGVVLTHRREPLTMSELSEALAVPMSTATRIVDWLVESGYAERLPDPDDRRIVRVGLTATGCQVHQTYNEFIRRQIDRILLRLSAQERLELVRLLQKVVGVVLESGSSTPGESST